MSKIINKQKNVKIGNCDTLIFNNVSFGNIILVGKDECFLPS